MHFTKAAQWSWPWWKDCGCAGPDDVNMGELTPTVWKAAHSVMSAGEQSLPLTSYCTGRAGPALTWRAQQS